MQREKATTGFPEIARRVCICKPQWNPSSSFLVPSSIANPNSVTSNCTHWREGMGLDSDELSQRSKVSMIAPWNCEIVSPHVLSLFHPNPHHTKFNCLMILFSYQVCVGSIWDWELGLGQRRWGFSGNFYLSSQCQSGRWGGLWICGRSLHILIPWKFWYMAPWKIALNINTLRNE